MIDDETLDRQLREAVPYINDDGFTARVIAEVAGSAARAAMAACNDCRWPGVTRNRSRLLPFRWRSASFVEGMIQMADFPIWLLLVFAFGCGLVVGAFAVIFAIRKTPEVRDLTRLDF